MNITASTKILTQCIIMFSLQKALRQSKQQPQPRLQIQQPGTRR